jgi:hypothetical protein
MNNIRIQISPTDYVFGSSSPITFSSVVPSGDWTKQLAFFERQKYAWDNDGCICYADQESFDAQMDALMPTFPASFVTLLNQLDYMDLGMDGGMHFHSSPRFVQINTGNGMNGNALQDPWNAMRNFGVLPWKDLPFDATITQEQFFESPTQDMFNKAIQFLVAFGGKNTIQYHWLCTGTTNTKALDSARPQAPIPVAVAAVAPNWNKVMPAIDLSAPGHGVLNYKADVQGEWVLDHYNPFQKVLQSGYPINFALQGVITPNFPPPAPTPPSPTFPADPTPAQQTAWYDWIINTLKWLKILES